jgi:hypothetical protein
MPCRPDWATHQPARPGHAHGQGGHSIHGHGWLCLISFFTVSFLLLFSVRPIFSHVGPRVLCARDRSRSLPSSPAFSAPVSVSRAVNPVCDCDHRRKMQLGLSGVGMKTVGNGIYSVISFLVVFLWLRINRIYNALHKFVFLFITLSL